mmetsp:Transcript_18918/g.43442  ORF Transcript_18918/g.43442 Transcript_18918/m.43442 type:complete len:376 (-) Transcript_18918:1086-2213(-)
MLPALGLLLCFLAVGTEDVFDVLHCAILFWSLLNRLLIGPILRKVGDHVGYFLQLLLGLAEENNSTIRADVDLAIKRFLDLGNFRSSNRDHPRPRSLRDVNLKFDLLLHSHARDDLDLVDISELFAHLCVSHVHHLLDDVDGRKLPRGDVKADHGDALLASCNVEAEATVLLFNQCRINHQERFLHLRLRFLVHKASLHSKNAGSTHSALQRHAGTEHGKGAGSYRSHHSVAVGGEDVAVQTDGVGERLIHHRQDGQANELGSIDLNSPVEEARVGHGCDGRRGPFPRDKKGLQELSSNVASANHTQVQPTDCARAEDLRFSQLHKSRAMDLGKKLAFVTRTSCFQRASTITSFPCRPDVLVNLADDNLVETPSD